jgi:serine/threonine-protein kinase
LVGGQVDFRTDFYSLGAVAYFALLGRPPFEGRTVDQIALGRIGVEVPDLRALRPDVPEALEKVLRKATSMDPGGRYTSAAGFRKAIDRSMRKSAEIPAPADDAGPITRMLRKL